LLEYLYVSGFHGAFFDLFCSLFTLCCLLLFFLCCNYVVAVFVTYLVVQPRPETCRLSLVLFLCSADLFVSRADSSCLCYDGFFCVLSGVGYGQVAFLWIFLGPVPVFLCRNWVILTALCFVSNCCYYVSGRI